MVFTNDNTKGFTEEQLQAMNEEFEISMAEYDKDDRNYMDIEKHIAEKICNDFSNPNRKENINKNIAAFVEVMT